MRWWSSFALSSLLAAAGCDGGAVAPPPADRPAADVAADDVADVADVAAQDVVADVAEEGMCTLDVGGPDTSGPMNGFIRFVHAVRGAGTVRFTATNLPGFAPAHVEVVLREGESTEHVSTLPVAYEVRVTPAGDASPGVVVDASSGDAGMLTDGPSAPPTPCDASVRPGEVVPPTCADVYFFAGCTVALVGSASGDPARQTDRRLWRISDIPARTTDCDTGTVRTLNAYAEGPSLDVDRAGGAPLARATGYRETTGFRTVPAGPLRVSVRAGDAGAALGEFVAGSVTPGHAHTLYVWGDARNAAMPGVSAFVLDDVSPTFR